MKVVCDSKKIDEIMQLYNIYTNSYGIKSDVDIKKLVYINQTTKSRVDVYNVSSKLNNVEIIARYNAITYKWDSDVPEEAQHAYNDVCWICHHHQQCDGIILIRVDDKYHVVNETCYSRLNIDEWFAAYQVTEFDDRDYIIDSDSTNRQCSENYWDMCRVYQFVKDYPGIFFSDNVRKRAVVDIENHPSYMERIKSNIK